eukprot:364191-Chlamydomonas_euryale.AAC.12
MVHDIHTPRPLTNSGLFGIQYCGQLPVQLLDRPLPGCRHPNRRYERRPPHAACQHQYHVAGQHIVVPHAPLIPHPTRY